MYEPATETHINVEYLSEATEVLQLIDEMNREERKEFLDFIQGIRFARNLQSSLDRQKA